MSFFQVSSSDLHNSGDRLLELNQKLRSYREALEGNEQSLLTMWEGEAQESFHRAFVHDMGQMEAFIGIVDNYAKIMESIATRYDNTEARNLNIADTRAY